MKETVSTVFDDLEIGITLHDPDTGEIVGVNSRLEELYGYSEAELRAMEVADYSAVDAGFTQENAERRIRAAGGGEPQAFEWRIKRSTGEEVPVRVRLARTELDGEAYVIAEIREITERKQRQQELAAERQFIDQSLETIEDAFYMLDPNGHLVRWNSTVREVTGYGDTALDGMAAIDFFAESDRKRVAETVGKILDTGSGVVEAALLTADGEEVPYEFVGTRFTDTDGELRGIIGIGRDVAERAERLEALARQERAFRKLHQTASTTAPLKEKLADLLEFGRQYMGVEQGFFTRFDDGTQEIVVGVGPNDQLQEGASAPFSESYCRHTVDRDPDTPLSVTNAATEGWADDPAYERFGLACYVGSTVRVDGEIVGTICFADRDPAEREFNEIQETFVELLTEWVSYELERAERERKYRRLTERISDSYFAIDTDFSITYWNDVVAELTGIPADEILGSDLFEAFPEIEETVVEKRLREALADQKPTGCEYYFESLSHWAALQIYPDEDGLAVISKDITDRKAYEAELKRSNERLQEFAYILSHDLQEPLRMVSSYIDLLETELDEYLDDEAREYMGFAVDGADRMRGMIDGLLQYSRVETEGSEFAETDAEAVVEGVSDDLQFVLAESSVELSVGDLPTLQADADQLGQLFQNLVTNAVDHSGEGTTVEITATETAGGYEFAVSDDGPGIPADQQDEIFGLFNTGVDSDGTGIGLAICERIVKRHNGDIAVESTPSEGTTFRFSIETK